MKDKTTIKGGYSVKIKGFDVCDETMHVQVVEGEALSILTSKTGTWRSVRPLLAEGIAPCSHACPGAIRIREYLALLGEGKIKEAAALLMEDNPLATITGRVCPCFCEPDKGAGSDYRFWPGGIECCLLSCPVRLSGYHS